MSYFKCDYCNDNEVYIEVDDIPESVTCYKCHISHLKQELQKTREQLEIAEKVISADVGYNVFEFHRLREEYFKDKQGEG